MKTTLNFGALRDSIYRKSNGELLRESKNSTLAAFLDMLRGNSIVKKQHLIYKNFEKTKPFTSERLAERFIQQNLSIIKDESWPSLQNENAKMRQHLLGGPDEWTVMAKKENAELYENINTLIESSINKNFSDFERDAKAYSALVKHLTREEEAMPVNEEKERPEVNKFWRFITKNALNYFNERYEALSESERELFKILISEGEEKKGGINKMKKELVSLIEERASDPKTSRDDVVILESFKGKLAQEVDDEKLTSDEYIISCFELKESILKQ